MIDFNMSKKEEVVMHLQVVMKYFYEIFNDTSLSKKEKDYEINRLINDKRYFKSKKFNTNLKGLKKYLREFYKSHLSSYEESVKDKRSGLINHFQHVDPYGEHVVNVYIYENLKGIMDIIQNDINLMGDENNYDYSPTGLWFAGKAKVIKTDNRIFVIQGVALDC
ncbi:hypothetical protein [Bacillus pumilus]|uniref:hypothetical protein n=1 Tax=Bacillus pumilus TaxID=1408 RepID=UPI0011A0E630|nr:hypothetical protein [Bacillus pumilus]